MNGKRHVKESKKMYRHLFIAMFLMLFAFVLPSRAQTLDEIVNKYVAATGGAEKWKALETFAVVSRSESFSFDLYWKKPNRIRIEVPIEYPEPGLDIRSFDGTTGWRLNPMEGSNTPRTMSAEEILDLREMGDAYRELIDYKAKGYRLELTGKEVHGGKPAYRLKLTKPSGSSVSIFVDASSFLEIRRVVHAQSPEGEDREIVTLISDYRSVKGLLLPHRVGAAVREYQVNIAMDEKGFRMPGAESETTSAIANERIKPDLTTKVGTPEQRAELLKQHPEADHNKDGILTLEESWAFLKKDKAGRRLLPIGMDAPDWSLKDASGKAHRLSDYRGKLVLMDFWAVWCVPCHRAMAGLQNLHKELSTRGLVVLGISTNERGGDPARLMRDRGYTYQLLLNGETISDAYGVGRHANDLSYRYRWTHRSFGFRCE